MLTPVSGPATQEAPSPPAGVSVLTDEPVVERGTWVSRVVWFVLAAIPTAILVTATQLTPNPIGHGTHTQLGLPPCGFLLWTGVPCPGCGLTTCFAHMIRFEVVDAARANVFGVPLFLITLVGGLVAMVAFVRGLPVMATLERLQVEKIALAIAVCSITVWAVRIAVILAGR